VDPAYWSLGSNSAYEALLLMWHGPMTDGKTRASLAGCEAAQILADAMGSGWGAWRARVRSVYAIELPEWPRPSAGAASAPGATPAPALAPGTEPGGGHEPPAAPEHKTGVDAHLHPGLLAALQSRTFGRDCAADAGHSVRDDALYDIAAGRWPDRPWSAATDGRRGELLVGLSLDVSGSMRRHPPGGERRIDTQRRAAAMVLRTLAAASRGVLVAVFLHRGEDELTELNPAGTSDRTRYFVAPTRALATMPEWYPDERDIAGHANALPKSLDALARLLNRHGTARTARAVFGLCDGDWRSFGYGGALGFECRDSLPPLAREYGERLRVVGMPACDDVELLMGVRLGYVVRSQLAAPSDVEARAKLAPSAVHAIAAEFVNPIIAALAQARRAERVG
jgi:hypothetical protein